VSRWSRDGDQPRPPAYLRLRHRPFVVVLGLGMAFTAASDVLHGSVMPERSWCGRRRSRRLLRIAAGLGHSRYSLHHRRRIQRDGDSARHTDRGGVACAGSRIARRPDASARLSSDKGSLVNDAKGRSPTGWHAAVVGLGRSAKASAVAVWADQAAASATATSPDQARSARRRISSPDRISPGPGRRVAVAGRVLPLPSPCGVQGTLTDGRDHAVPRTCMETMRGGDRTWIAGRSGARDAAVSPMKRGAKSKTRNRTAG